MKVQIIIAALATVLLPVHGADQTGVQCAGGVPDSRGEGSGIIYENTGFLTADFTQNVCATAGGTIDPNTKGNQKCCTFPSLTDPRIRTFNIACESQQAGSDFPNFRPFPRDC
ncbi:hypothetical protein ON010_g17645 [Phytophthora cinnamomi]|nr:hypothetical protein ON010_g17645 [Phytophthora cinnamomi]